MIDEGTLKSSWSNQVGIKTNNVWSEFGKWIGLGTFLVTFHRIL